MYLVRYLITSYACYAHSYAHYARYAHSYARYTRYARTVKSNFKKLIFITFKIF